MSYIVDEQEEDVQLLQEETYMQEFQECEEEPYDDMEEPPIRKNKRIKGGGWIPLLNRRAA